MEVCEEYIAKQCHLRLRAIFLQSIFINSHILKFQPHYVNISLWFWDVAGIMFTMLCQRQRVELLTEVSGGNFINHSGLITGVTTVFEGLILFAPCWETGPSFTGSWDCKVQVIGSVDHQTFYFVSKACTYLKLEFTLPSNICVKCCVQLGIKRIRSTEVQTSSMPASSAQLLVCGIAIYMHVTGTINTTNSVIMTDIIARLNLEEFH